jgi:hypothetical protein
MSFLSSDKSHQKEDVEWKEKWSWNDGWLLRDLNHTDDFNQWPLRFRDETSVPKVIRRINLKTTSLKTENGTIWYPKIAMSSAQMS